MNFNPLCYGKKTFYAKSALHLLVPDFVLIEFCQFFRLVGMQNSQIFLFTESICISQNLFAYVPKEGKNIFLISSILTEIMHPNSNCYEIFDD